jgi:hypothetical protein
MQVMLWAGVIGFYGAAFATESKACQLPAPLYVVICSERCTLSEIDNAGVIKALKQVESWRQFEPAYHRQPGSSPSDPWGSSGVVIDRHMDAGVLDTPAAMALDRSRVAAAIAPPDEFNEYDAKEDFAVFNESNRVPSWRRHVNGSVESLAWSPDASAIAVLIGAPAEKSKRGVVDAVARVFGWRVEHRRGWLEVFDVEGARQCRIELYSDLRTPTAYVVWSRRP